MNSFSLRWLLGSLVFVIDVVMLTDMVFAMHEERAELMIVKTEPRPVVRRGGILRSLGWYANEMANVWPYEVSTDKALLSIRNVFAAVAYLVTAVLGFAGAFRILRGIGPITGFLAFVASIFLIGIAIFRSSKGREGLLRVPFCGLLVGRTLLAHFSLICYLTWAVH